ncbi:hypothetical protein LXL04_010834 [Taraxacum kok-saghyz]
MMATKLFLGFILLSCFYHQSAMGRFVAEKNSLTVSSPESIKGNHDTAIRNFGIPQYGGSMAGNVSYPKENRKGCREFNEFGISFKAKPSTLSAFVLLDRGEDSTSSKYIENITIPSALISKTFDESLKKSLSSVEMVNVNLDWRESVPHPDDELMKIG